MTEGCIAWRRLLIVLASATHAPPQMPAEHAQQLAAERAHAEEHPNKQVGIVDGDNNRFAT